MGIAIPPDVWEPNLWPYFLLFSASSASILLFPFFLSKISSRKAGSSTYPSQFPRFQRSFLVAYCLVSVVEGIQNVFGEIEYVGNGLNREQMVLVLSSGGVAILLVGTFSGASFRCSLGFRKELLSDAFWLMTFMLCHLSAGAVAVQVRSVAISKIFQYRRIWLLACAHSAVHFSIAIFWLLWAPTVVADGREVALGLIYPCLLGARMFGSTMVPWTFSGVFSIEIEDFLAITFMVVGFSFSVIAYDYQEIAVLVVLFCIIHGSFGLTVPSLARLRSMYVPSEMRAGMMSLSLVPANAGILYVLIQGGRSRKLDNSTIMALSSFGLFSATVCIQLLKRKWWQRNYNQHVL